MRVLFAGGGTGGHINPAISIADMQLNRIRILRLCLSVQNRDFETKLVPKAGYDIEYIEIQGFDRKHIFQKF